MREDPRSGQLRADMRTSSLAGEASQVNGDEERTTEAVIDDHLRRRQSGDLEGDLRNNYHSEVRLLSSEGVHHGHDGVRMLATVLRRYLPAGEYRYRQCLTDGEVGMLVWSGRCARENTDFHDGVDSFVVRDGRIAAQTIHYSVHPLHDQTDDRGFAALTVVAGRSSHRRRMSARVSPHPWIIVDLYAPGGAPSGSMICPQWRRVTMFSDAQAVWEWRDGVDAFRGRHVGSMGVVGYDVEATDGRIGTIDGSSRRFGVSCLVVDADSWITGRKILVPAGTVADIDRDDRTVRLDRSRADVERSPGYDPETFTRPQYRDRVAYYFAGTYDDTPAR